MPDVESSLRIEQPDIKIADNAEPLLRDDLDALGVVPADRLLTIPDGNRVLVAGAVTHRQRPGTARGVTFLNLEDETGMVNVLCTPGVWARHRRVAQTAPAGYLAACAVTPPCSATARAPRMSPRRIRKKFRPARRRNWRARSWKASASASPPSIAERI